MKISVNAQPLITFENFQQWVDRAAGAALSVPNKLSEKIICVDVNGNVCNNGSDMQHARDNGLFPITMYRMHRTKEWTLRDQAISELPYPMDTLLGEMPPDKLLEYIADQALGRLGDGSVQENASARDSVERIFGYSVVEKAIQLYPLKK